MADETPDQPAADHHDGKPAPRRRAPRKAAPKSDASKSASKSDASKPAPKRSRSTAAAKKPSTAATAAKSRSSAPKRSSAKSSNSTTARAQATLDKATETVGGKRNAAFLAGGLAVAGAAAAALLSLRGSTAKNKSPSPTEPNAKAHQPDGEDSSKSFEAGIADENTIPETPAA